MSAMVQSAAAQTNCYDNRERRPDRPPRLRCWRVALIFLW
jgi:hypothetical protein